MADDRVGAGDEGLLIARNLLEILALQAFGGELDRRQRILDLMGDTPCDIGPGRLALGREEFRYVIEGNDEPFDFMRSEEHTSELQSLMRISYPVFCLKK